jgi:hypothetical protein
MFDFLNKKYPFNINLKHNAKIVFFISVGVLGFIFVFQPIEIEKLLTKIDLLYLASCLAVSTFLVLSLNLIVLPSFFPKLFERDKWNIKKEIIWNFWTLIVISFSYYFFYAKLFGISIIDYSALWKITILGIIPIAVLIVINHNNLLRSHLKTSEQLNNKLNERKNAKEKLISIDSEYKKDKLELKASDIILIKAADNYIEIHYNDDGEIKNRLIRNTIKNMEEKLKKFSFIIKCHRSFIVNTNHIQKVQGNSQGYKLFFENTDVQAFVSQMYIPDFKKHFHL